MSKDRLTHLLRCSSLLARNTVHKITALILPSVHGAILFVCDLYAFQPNIMMMIVAWNIATNFASYNVCFKTLML
jgi:hypothetical protein